MQSDETSETEIVNQHAVLKQMFPVRVISSVIAYSVMAIYLPLWICIVAFSIDQIAARLSVALMHQIDPQQQRARYAAVILAIFVTEIAFSIPVLMIWQLDAPYAKALAVGLICTTTFQIASVRSLHLVFGIVALSTVMTTSLIGNAIYWQGLGDGTGLTVSTIAILAASAYFASAMVSGHNLHSELNSRGVAAQAASLAKGRFIAQISHELRTPLNAIIGMGLAEQAEARTAAAADRMDVLVSSAKGLAVILDDILDISALEGKGVTIRPRPVSPATELAHTVALFRPQFDAAQLKLVFICAPNLPKLAMIDPSRLRQCLSNLLSNALKFTAAGQVMLNASMCGDMLRIDVQDSGRGIDKELTDQLFVYFQRGRDAQSGTGLGLAISRGLARQMGGDLALIPSAQGAHFRLSVLATTVLETSPSVMALLPSNMQPLQVLVVDDIATNRLVATTYLRGLGLNTTEAASGAEALLMIQKQPPDLIFLDMNMPEMTGLECFNRIRQISMDWIPVLAMTANADLLHRQHYAVAGLDGFLAKPLTPESVRAALLPYLPAA